MPTTDCIPQTRLDFHPDRPVDLCFDGPQTSVNGGVILLRQLDDRLGLTAVVAAHLGDDRAAARITHPLHDLLRQRVFQIALGYPDANDAATLRHDPAFKTALAHLPADATALASQPTLSRLETAVTARDVVAVQRALERAYVDRLAADTTAVVLDLDSTDDPTHGQQAFTFFNGHYGGFVYLPMLMFDGDGRLVSVRLRPGNAGAYRYALPMVERVIRLLKARFPAVQIAVRGDGGFAAPSFLAGLDDLRAEFGGIDYVLGEPKNAVLLRKAADAMAVAAAQHAETGQATRTFTAFAYAAGSWDHARHIVAKAEHLPLGPNPRFVVTTLDEFPPRVVYEWAYCERGQAENRIKDLKNALAADRLSCSDYVANAFRLLLHAVAYRLMFALRTEVAGVAPALATVQFDTLRTKLLKVVAQVRQTARRIVLTLPQAFGLAAVFRALAVRFALPVPAS